MRFARAPEYAVFPTREPALKPYQAAVRAAAETAPLIREARPARRGGGHPHASRRRWPPRCEGRPWATLVPHVLPVGEPGFPPYSSRGPAAAHAGRGALWRPLRPLLPAARGSAAATS